MRLTNRFLTSFFLTISLSPTSAVSIFRNLWVMNRADDKDDKKFRRFHLSRISKYLPKFFFYASVASTLSILYVFSFHRVRSLNDLNQIYNVIALPNHDHRCKRFNGSHFICLPNVFLIGASKCGTTSLMDHLIQHPLIDHVRRRIHKIDEHREVHRFDRNTYGWSSRIIEQYDEWASCPIISDPNMTVLHYTPHYLYAPSVPFEMKQFYPKPEELKFIVILRDPVDRSQSSYWFRNSHIFNGHDQGSVAEFMKLARFEISLREQYEKCMMRKGGKLTNSSMSRNKIQFGRKSLTFESPHLHSSALKFCFGSLYRDKSLGSRHIDKGIYHDQIQRWYDNFPSHNFYFISLKKFERNSVVEFQRLLDFILSNSSEKQNLIVFPDLTSSSFLNINKSSTALANILARKRLVNPNLLRSNQSLPQEFLRDLRMFYKPYNDELDKYLGEDFL